MESIKKLLHLQKNSPSEDEVKQMVREIQAEDVERKKKVANVEVVKQAEREAKRKVVRADIERRIRERFLYGDRAVIEKQLQTKHDEHVKVADDRMLTSIAAIERQLPATRVRGGMETIREKHGFNIIYKKSIQGKYWKVLSARRKDNNELVSLTIMDLVKAPPEKRENMDKWGFKIQRFLTENPHPTIVNVYDQMLVDTEYYCFHEIMTTNLDRYLSHGPVASEFRSSAWGYHLADAIAFIHSHGIAHRDINPMTIWMTDKLDIKLGNFGYACIFLGQ